MNEIYYMLPFYQLHRTKVECAGLCLSMPDCVAFQWIGSSDEQPNNICRTLDKEKLCFTIESDKSVEIYASSNENFSLCNGKKIPFLSVIDHF